MPNSLYRTWQKRVAEQPDATALIDAVSGQAFTFAELDNSKMPPAGAPRGMSPRFVQQTLGGWCQGEPLVMLDGHTNRIGTEIPDGIAHVKTTSGSTGEPRFILFTAEQLAADAANIVATMGLSAERPNVGVISMSHSYGFSNLVLPLLLHGIPLILGGDPLPGSLARALDHLPEPGGTVPAVPAMWRAWLNAGCLDPNKIRLAISAGAPLTLDLERDIFERTGIKVHNFYGSSECGGIAYDQTPAPREHAGTVGTTMHGVTTSINDDGCLSVSGPAVGTGYWPEADPGTLDGKRFVTQDLAAIAPDGTIQLNGRAGDLINVAGRKLDPATIEAQLRKHADVEHCVVFGVPSKDPERVQEIVAVASGGETAELNAMLARALPAWQKVRHWWINADLSPNSRGKISRHQWRESWLQEQRHPGSGLAPETPQR